MIKLAAEDSYNGWQGEVYKGPSGTEVLVGKIDNTSLNISTGLTPHYEAGTVTPYTIKEGNLLVSGVIAKGFINGGLLTPVIGTTSIINFVGINNGSATHIYKDKEDTDGNTKLAHGSWAGTELSSVNYDKVEADDASIHSNTATSVGDYAAHLIKFDAPGTETDIDLMQFEFIGRGTGDTNGFEVFVYNFDTTTWISLGTSDAGAALSSLTAILEDTEQYQEVTTGDIYFLVRSRVAKTTLDNVLYCDYAELRVFNTTAVAAQEDFSLILKMDATTDISITIANVKLSDWTMSFDNAGNIVLEGVGFTGKTVTQA